jgi:MFS superfamily sulfate permease-like transporter
LILGAASLAILFMVAAYAPSVPSALIVLVLGVLSVKLFGLDNRGVEVVGDIKARLPSLTLPEISINDVGDIFLGTVGIVVVLTAEALAAGRTFAAKHNYETEPNQELAAMGAANLASGLFGGMIVGGGMSGTAANDSAGARTQLSTIVAAVFVALTIVFLLSYIRLLPEAVLAAIVIHAVAHLVDVKTLRFYAKIKTGSVWVELVAIFGVLLLGILKGLMIAVGFTLFAVMKKLSTPQESILGRLPGTEDFVDIHWHPEAEPIEGVLIIRPNAMLFFANSNRVLNQVRALMKRAVAPVRAVILDLEASPEVDITSVQMLDQMNSELKVAGTTLYLTKVPNRVLELFDRSGFRAKLKDEQIYEHVRTAVKALTGTKMVFSN